MKTGRKQDLDEPQGLPRARGIDRVIDILEHLYRRGKPLRPNEIAAGIGAPKSTVYEIAHRLADARILEVFDDEGRVFLGRRLYYYGSAYLETFDLVRQADRFLVSLTEETRETSQLCMVEGNQYTVASMREGVRPFKISADVGQPIPLTWTASGRVFMTGMTDEEVLRFVPAGDFVLPTGARLSPDLFMAQVRQARDQGFYDCDSVIDSFTHCFAAPVRDERGRCVATLCLVVSREDAAQRRDELLVILGRHARDLSVRLGAEAALGDPVANRRAPRGASWKPGRRRAGPTAGPDGWLAQPK